MALQFLDGFDSYAATADLTKKWTLTGGANVTWSSNAGRIGGGAVQWNNSNQSLSLNLWPNGKFSATVYTGFWFKASGKPSSVQAVCALQNSGQGFTGGLVVDTNGKTNFDNQQGGLTAGILNVCDGNWHWIECAFVLAAQTTPGGSFTWYVDTQLEGTGVGGGNAFGFNVTVDARYIYLAGMSGTSVTTVIDDFYVHDNAGNAPTGGSWPYGPRLITTSRPNLDSAVQFTPDSGGSNFARVNDVNADDDTSYVQDNVSGHQDLYGFSALGYTPANITGVMLGARMKDSGDGSINYALVGKSGGTTRAGTTTVTPPNYLKITQMEFGVDPNTSAAWTPTNLGNATFGIKVV